MCEKCNDTGFVRDVDKKIDEIEYETYKRCECNRPTQTVEKKPAKNNKKQWWKELE
jgi:hypothetical protein